MSHDSTTPDSQWVTETHSWGPDDAPIAVLALHGRGQSVETIRDLRERIGIDHLRWEVPMAPDHTWYPYRFMDPEVTESRELARALESVTSAVTALNDAGFGRDRIVVLGFSQGGCLASQWSLQQIEKVAGLVVFTGGYIGAEGPPPRVAGDFSHTRALISGPQDDPWVPLSRMQETDALLRGHGASVTTCYLPPGEHAISDTEVCLARTFLQEFIHA